MAAEAVAAGDRADAGDDEEGPPGVLLEEPGRAESVRLGERVGGESRDLLLLGAEREHLAEERVVRVAMAHPSEEAARDDRGEEPRRAMGPRAQGLGEAERVDELVGVADRVAERPLPRRRCRDRRGARGRRGLLERPLVHRASSPPGSTGPHGPDRLVRSAS